MMVFHTNGIHCVSLDFCGCSNAAPDCRQILEAGWFPATPLEPQTCATNACLRQFQTLNLQGNISPYDYYTALELMTDPLQTLNLPVSIFLKSPCVQVAYLSFDRTDLPPSCFWYANGDTSG